MIPASKANLIPLLEIAPMASGRLILLGLLGLVVAEAAVFLAVARTFGSFVALFTLFATSVLWPWDPRPHGQAATRWLADMLSRRDIADGIRLLRGDFGKLRGPGPVTGRSRPRSCTRSVTPALPAATNNERPAGRDQLR